MKKDYILLDTIGKTQKANNNLIISEEYNSLQGKTKYLYDFSLLKKHITDIDILQRIQSDCMKHTSVAFKEQFITIAEDNFTWYTATVYFRPYTVYSNSKNKRVYNIMQAVYLDYTKQYRTCIYDNFTIVESIHDTSAHDIEVIDCEIA
jgi:hypothetical protein